MSEAQTRILELFRMLSPDEQREVAGRLKALADEIDFYEQMTPEQRAELRDAIRQADAGQVISSDELKAYFVQRFGTSDK
jgi:hypothetical protein